MINIKSGFDMAMSSNNKSVVQSPLYRSWSFKGRDNPGSDNNMSMNNNHPSKMSLNRHNSHNRSTSSSSQSRRAKLGQGEVEPSNLLVPALAVAQKILLVPFELRFNHRLNAFHIKIKLRQKILVAFLSLVSTIQIVWEAVYYARLNGGKLGRNGQEKWAMYAIYSTWWLYHVAIVSIFWWRHTKLVSLINQIRHVSAILKYYQVDMCPKFCRFFPWFLLPTAVAWELFYYVIIDNDFEKFGLSSLASSYLTRGTNVYFLRDQALNQSLGENLTNGSVSDHTRDPETSSWYGYRVVAGCFYMVCLIYSNLLTNFGQYFVLLASLCTWILVRSYIRLLWQSSLGQTPSTVKTQQILDMYDEICKLFELVNSSIGDVIALTCLAMLPFYSLKLIDLFDGQWKFKVQYLYYAANFGGILFPAAGSNTMIRGIIPWLRTQEAQTKLSRYKIYNNYNLKQHQPDSGLQVDDEREHDILANILTPHMKNSRFLFASGQSQNTGEGESANENVKDLRFRINLIVHELSGNCVGIKGRFFRISFEFIGNILSLIGTYAVIFFQFRSYAREHGKE